MSDSIDSPDIRGVGFGLVLKRGGGGNVDALVKSLNEILQLLTEAEANSLGALALLRAPDFHSQHGQQRLSAR